MKRTLTPNDIEVLKFLTKNLTKDFTILKIAKGTGKTNRLVYAAVKRLIKEKIIIVEEKANLKLCRLNLEMPHIIALIESIRWHDFAQGHRDVDLLISDIIARSALPFFTLVVFGSYAKGTAIEASDLDILIIIPDRKFEASMDIAIKSATSLSTITLHPIIVSYTEFLDMLRENKINVAKEVLEARYVTYGAEPFYTMVGRTL